MTEGRKQQDAGEFIHWLLEKLVNELGDLRSDLQSASFDGSNHSNSATDGSCAVTRADGFKGGCTGITYSSNSGSQNSSDGGGGVISAMFGGKTQETVKRGDRQPFGMETPFKSLQVLIVGKRITTLEQALLNTFTVGRIGEWMGLHLACLSPQVWTCILCRNTRCCDRVVQISIMTDVASCLCVSDEQQRRKLWQQQNRKTASEGSSRSSISHGFADMFCSQSTVDFRRMGC